jgi:hypothetical protein
MICLISLMVLDKFVVVRGVELQAFCAEID